MFAVALFTVAKTGKQPKGPLVDEGIKKMQYVQGLSRKSPAIVNITRMVCIAM